MHEMSLLSRPQIYIIHCYSLIQTQDSTSEPCGLRLSSLLLGHGCSLQYWFNTSEQRRNFFLWSLNARAGFESVISRLSKQAVLTTAPGSQPYRPYSISSCIRSTVETRYRTASQTPEYGPLFFSPIFFPIHIIYYQIQKADRPAIRGTDHPFPVPNHKRTRKTDQPQQQNKIHTFTVIYASIKGPAATGFTNGLDLIKVSDLVQSNKGPALAGSTKRAGADWIHKSGQRWLDPLSSDWIMERISAGEINHRMLIQHLNIVISANCNHSPYHVMALPWVAPLRLADSQRCVLAPTTVFLY